MLKNVTFVCRRTPVAPKRGWASGSPLDKLSKPLHSFYLPFKNEKERMRIINNLTSQIHLRKKNGHFAMRTVGNTVRVWRLK